MQRSLLMLGSLFGFFGVALGAFGAHALRRIVTPEMLAVFETAVRYHMFHTLAIVGTALLVDRYPTVQYAGRLFGAGILLFSGSLYLMTLSGNTTLGMITPFGGLCFLGGWGVLFYSAWKIKKEN